MQLSRIVTCKLNKLERKLCPSLFCAWQRKRAKESNQESYWIYFVPWVYSLPISAVSGTQRVVIWLLSHFHIQIKLPDIHLWLNQGVRHEFLIKIKFLFLELQENFPPTVPISLMVGRSDGNAAFTMWVHSGFLWACSVMAKCLLLPWQLIASTSNADALRFSP